MINILRLPEKLRARLKEPLGTLISGNFQETMEKLRKLIEKEKPLRIIAVGDAISECMIKNGIQLNLFIVDNKIMRQPITPLKFKAKKTLYAKNPAGTISDDAWMTIKKAMETDIQTKIVIEGEEDLLALPAILFAPKKSFVVYGQPKEGIVVVRVTAKKKAEVKSIIDAMEVVDSKN